MFLQNADISNIFNLLSIKTQLWEINTKWPVLFDLISVSLHSFIWLSACIFKQETTSLFAYRVIKFTWWLNVFLLMLTMPAKINIVSTCWKVWCLYAYKASPFFLEILPRHCTLVILSTFGMPCHAHQKW